MQKLKNMVWQQFEIDLDSENDDFIYDLEVFFNTFSVPLDLREGLTMFFRYLKALASCKEPNEEAVDFFICLFNEEIKFLRSLVNSN